MNDQQLPSRHLVTGAAGLIGFELTKQLLESGSRVVTVDNYLKGGREDLLALAEQFPSSLEIVEADLAQPEVLKQIRGPIDTIYHLAAIVGVAYVNANPYETMRVNALSTLAVTDFAIREGCRAFVFASSSENYACSVENGWVTLPTPEDVTLSIGDIALPRWSYAASKIAGESAVFGAAPLGKFSPLIVRFHNVYGPRMGPTHVIPEFVKRCAEKTDPFPVFGYDATRSFLHVYDAARALQIIAAESNNCSGIFNIGSPEEVKIAELLEIVLKVGHHAPRIDKHPAPPGSVTRRVPKLSKLKSLGFAPTIALAEGIQGCFDALAER